MKDSEMTSALVLPEPAATTTRYDGSLIWQAGLNGTVEKFGAKLFTEQQVRAILADAAGLHMQSDCERCQGSGEDPEGYFDQSRGPDGDTHDGPCRACAGTGEAPQTQAGARDALTPAARDVLAERQRQISVEGWTPERDDKYGPGALSDAGGCYAIQAYGGKQLPEVWPWTEEWWKPSEAPRRNLEKAGALILAEIERIDRAAAAIQQAKEAA